MVVLTELIRVINMVINMVPNMIRMGSFENKEVILKAAFFVENFFWRRTAFDKIFRSHSLY